MPPVLWCNEIDDATAVAAKHTALVSHRDAGNFLAQMIHRAGGKFSEEAIATIGANSTNVVMTFE